MASGCPRISGVLIRTLLAMIISMMRRSQLQQDSLQRERLFIVLVIGKRQYVCSDGVRLYEMEVAK